MVSLKRSEEIVLSLYPKMISIAHKRLRNIDDSKDLVQNTMYKIFKNLYSGSLEFKTESSISPYCVMALKNIHANHYKYNARHPKSSIEELDFFEPIEKVRTDSLLLQSEIESHVQNLNEKIREPFMLYHQGYSYEEISQKFSIPMGTVKNRIFRSKKALMSKLN